MNHDPKITLSDEELQLVKNTGWILTKHVITGKVYELLGDLSQKYKELMGKELLPLEILQSTPKISKGENYLQLPYVLLDYPRCYTAKNIFAIRTMFWWGNFFSITLQLSGDYKTMFEQQLLIKKEKLQQEKFYVCISGDGWQHHFEKTNYCPIEELGQKEFEELIHQKTFIKLAIKFPLEQWSQMPEALEKSFFEILKLLKS